MPVMESAAICKAELATSLPCDCAQYAWLFQSLNQQQLKEAVRRCAVTLQDTLTRRVQVVCSPDSTDNKSSPAIAMYFVTAGQIPQLRAVEGFLGAATLEVMPVHVADILQQTRQSNTAS